MANNPVMVFESIDTAKLATIKDDKCREICMNIASVINDTVAINVSRTRQVAEQLASITPEMYKAEGYKSLAEFGSDKLSIKDKLVYSLAKAGTMYGDDTINDTIKTLPPSKIVELSGVTIAAPEGVKDAMLDKVNADAEKLSGMTQAELREYAKDVKASFSAKPVDGNKNPGDDPVKPKKVTLFDVVVLTSDEKEVPAGLQSIRAACGMDTSVKGPLLMTLDDLKWRLHDNNVFQVGYHGTGEEQTKRYLAIDGEKAVLFVLEKHETPKAAKGKGKSKSKAAIDISSMSTEDIVNLMAALQAKMKNN